MFVYQTKDSEIHIRIPNICVSIMEDSTMEIDSVLSRTVKEMVTEDFRAAAVFEKYSIDFCCGGKKTLQAACAEKGLSTEELARELARIGEIPAGQGISFASYPLDLLIRHIKETHHEYVRRMVPILLSHTQKIAGVHGSNHPELPGVAARFEAIAHELASHMVKEERVLFPYIEELAWAERGKGPVASPPFGTVRNPIAMMEAEHQSAGDGLYWIREATSGYTAPEDACTTYRVTLQELKEFEEDLHRHVHLENNILFPKAAGLREI